MAQSSVAKAQEFDEDCAIDLWAQLAERLASDLSKQGAFQKWEAKAISSAMIEAAKVDGTLNEKSLADKLHARQLPRDLSRSLAHVIVRAYG
jgi:hypothetical protein